MKNPTLVMFSALLLCATASPAQTTAQAIASASPTPASEEKKSTELKKAINQASSPAPKKIDEPVVLDVFTVRADESDPYRAMNSSAGTRYDSPMKELPLQVDVLTTDFIRDIGAVDLRDALAYAGGIQLTTGTGNQSEDQPDNQYFQIRGVSGGQPYKDGFKRTFQTDTISIGRVDVIKGPGGPLYEYGALGGTVSYSTPQPKARREYYFRQYFGDESFQRTEFSTNGALIPGRLNHFIGVAYQQGDSIINAYYAPKYSYHKRLTVTQSFTARVNDRLKLTLNLDYQYLDRDNLGGSGRATGGLITDNSALNGVNLGYTIPGRSLTNQGNRVLYDPTAPDPEEWLRTFRYDGPDTYSKQRSLGTTIRADYAFSRDFQMWFGYNVEDRHTKDRGYTIAVRNWNDNTNVPVSIRTDPRFLALLRGPAIVPNAQGVIVPDALHQVLDIRPNNISNDSINYRPMWKGEIYYHFKLLKGDHRVIAGYTWQNYYSDTAYPRYAFDYTNSLWNNLPADVILSRFRSLTDYTTVKRWDSAMFARYPVPATSSNGLIPYTTSNFIDQVYYANLASSYLKGKIQTTVGLTDLSSNRRGRVYDPAGKFLWAGPAQIAGYPSGIMRPEPVRHLDPSLNIAYVANEHLTVFANGSASTDPGPAYSSYDGQGQPMDPPHASNREIGLHSEFWKRKILFDASYFQNTTDGAIRGIPAAFQNFPFNPANGNSYTWGFNANTVTSIATKGYDLKLDFIVTDELRLRASYTNQKAAFTKVGDLGVPGSDNPTFRAQQNAVAALNLTGADYIGTDPNDNSRHEASGFIRYERRRGAFKGFWIFTGVKYSGTRTSTNLSFPVVGGVPSATPSLVNTYVPSRLVFDLNLGYRRKIGKYRTEVGMNIINLTDNQDWYSSYWNPPRTIRFYGGVTF